MNRPAPTLLLAAVLAAAGSVAAAEDFAGPPDIPTPRPIPNDPKPIIEIIVVENADLSPANRHADRGDARTLQQAQAYADAGDARTLNAANQHSAAQVAGLQREAFAGIAAAAALVPMEPNADGQTTLNVGAATYGGQAALGLALSHQVGRTVVNAGVGFGSKRALVRVGLGWRF